MLLILFPILVTVIGLAYILSPIDILPEIFLGPIGLTDDAIVAGAIVASWLSFFGINVFASLIAGISSLLVMIIAFVILLLIFKAITKPKNKKR